MAYSEQVVASLLATHSHDDARQNGRAGAYTKIFSRKDGVLAAIYIKSLEGYRKNSIETISKIESALELEILEPAFASC